MVLVRDRANELVGLRADAEIKKDPQKYQGHILMLLKKLESSPPDKELAHYIASLLQKDRDTLPYLFALKTILRDAVKNDEVTEHFRPRLPLWWAVVDFLAQCNPVEIRYAGASWKYLVSTFLLTAKYPDPKGVSASEDICAALRRALLHLDPEGSTFTLTQLQFVRLCVQRRAHHEALPVLANSIYRFPSRTSKVSNYPLKSVPACPSSNWITPTSGFTDTIRLVDIQQYYQLGAIAYLRSGDLPNASLYLEHVLATPAYNVPNAPMIEAYQTWLLVSLVLHGPSAPRNPKHVRDPVLRVMKSVSKLYEAIADAFESNDTSKLRAEIYEGRDILRFHGNLGLANEVERRHVARKVLKLASIYESVPRAMVAKSIGLDEEGTDEFIRMMGKRKEIDAYLDEQEIPLSDEEQEDEYDEDFECRTVIWFKEPERTESELTPLIKERDVAGRVSEKSRRIEQLARKVEEMDHRMSLTREGMEAARKEKRIMEDRANAMSDDAMEVTYEMVSDEDENVMDAK